MAGSRSEDIAVAELLVPMHGIGGRGDLPVPLWLAVYSAGAAMVAFTEGEIALVTAS